ncbi:MAG: PRC-barrel domain-containing protein [Gammaproteobacteria bacterium]|nr:PRC-barrel domain-containing protein [Gammaproteobacteria bacterium]
MIRIFLPLILAALGLAAASCSQSEAPFAPTTEAPASPQPTAHGAEAVAMPGSPDPRSTESDPSGSQAPASQPVADPTPDPSMPAERRASTLIGMPVVSTDGSPVGEVKDIIFDRQGRATHMVVAFDTEPQTGPAAIPDDGKPASSPAGKLTAMPWDAALASIKDGRVVLDGTKLQGAPSFTPDAWPNLDDPSWSATTDTYWRKAVRAAIAAHPGSPIDSTERQRGRRARGGSGNGDGN